jgi:hypothetical protein
VIMDEAKLQAGNLDHVLVGKVKSLRNGQKFHLAL